MLVLLALMMTVQACTLPPGGGSVNNGPPCATNTPNATLAKGNGVVAVVFLWFPPLPDGTSPAGGRQLSDAREIVCIMNEANGALITHYDISATGVYLMTSSMIALSPDNSTLYVSSISPQTTSTRLCGIGALSGTTLWCMNMTGYIGQAAVDDHALYLAESYGLEALDPKSGTVLWQQPGVDLIQRQTLALHGDYIYATTSDGITNFDELCAWRIKDGTAAWCAHSYKDQGIFQFSVDAGYATMSLRLASGVLVQEMRASDGTELWQKLLPDIVIEQTLNAGPSVYIEMGVYNRLDYKLLSLDAATGASQWTRDDQKEVLYLVGGANGFAAVRAGTLLGYLPASSGSAKPAWQRTLDAGHISALVTQQSVDYFADSPGALRLGDGKRLWQAGFCASGSESAPTHDSDGATIWCHWPNVGQGYQTSTVSGIAVFS
jgi:outer membrane protein assembly factor BamB